MRNLKRALSLLLSSAMVVGMMVMGGSAAGYQDVDASNQNQEAIEVLQAVGIMTGIDGEGNFAPDQSVTRNQMAVIMAHLLNLDYDYYRGTNTFSDVPEWAAPYVAACVAEGVTAGIGDNLYGGENKITAAQASLMIMKALGYFQNAEDFGDDWQIATVRQASYINLFDKVNSSAESALTRGQVAQLVLNGLKAKMVDFTGDKGIQIGDVTVGYKAEYTAKTNAAEKYNTIDDGTTNIAQNDQYYVQLGEELYNGDLKLSSTSDEFGRPSRYWEYDGDEIGTYVKNELIRKEYTAKVTGKDLYDLLGASTVDTYKFFVSIDGVSDHNVNGKVFNETSINPNNKNAVGTTGNGVLTQVFVDTNAKNVYISIIDTYLAIADGDYDEQQEELDLTVYAVDKKNSGEYVKTLTDNVSDTESMTVSSEDFDVVDVKDGDLFLVTIANGEIQTMAAPETLSGVEITAFKEGSNLTADGTQYDYSTVVEYDQETLEAYTNGTIVNLKDLTYNVYLDAYGYVIGVVEVEEPDNYLFITGVNGNYDNLSNVTYEANAIFLDGGMDTIKINAKKSDFTDPDTHVSVLNGTPDDATVNAWFTYTVNNDGVYTVDLVDVDAGLNELGQSAENRTEVIDYKHNSTDDGAANRVYGNDETVYLTASIDEITTQSGRTDVVIDDVDSVAVGIDNVDITPWDEATVRGDYTTATEVSYGIYTLYDEDGYIIAMVVVGEDNGNSDSLVYVHSDSVAQESYDKTTGEWTWTRTAIINGEEVTLTYVDDNSIALLNQMEENKWYRVRFNADGEVINVRSDDVDDDGNGVADEAGRLDQDFSFDNWDLYTYTVNTITSNANAPYAYIWDYNGVMTINAAINVAGVDTVLYHEGFVNNVPSSSGKTLYVTQDLDGYIRFTDDTKVVFEQMNNNEWTTSFWTGESGVEKAIKSLHEATATPTYSYEISAVIEDGRATSIIIHDKVLDGDDGNWTTNNMVENGNGMFRLWGDTNAKAEAISYNYNTDRVNYSFTMLDAAGAPVANTDITYTLTVKSKGDLIQTLNLEGTTNANGLLDDYFLLANFDEEVDVYISNVQTVQAPTGKVTLTLNEALGTLTAITVYDENGTAINPTTSGLFNKIYTLDANDQVIVDFGGSNASKGVFAGSEYVGTTDANGRLTLTVNASMTLDQIAAVYSIHTGTGVTLQNVLDGSGATVTPVAKSADGSIWYVKASDNAQQFQVMTEAAKAVFLTNSASDVVYTSSNPNATGMTPGVLANINNTTPINGNVYLNAAASVTTTSLSNSTITAGGQTVNSGDWVKLSETVTTALSATDGTGVIATTATKTANAANQSDINYVMTEENVTLNAAWLVNLNGITSIKLNTTGETVTDGMYVVDGKDLDIDTPASIVFAAGSPKHILDTTSGVDYGAAAETSDVTVSADVELSAAAEITLGTGSGFTAGIWAETSNSIVGSVTEGSTGSTLYVVSGLTVQVTGSSAVKITATNAPTESVDGTVITDDQNPNWMRYVVGVNDVTFDN